jgi:hypothetical protein
MKPIAHRLSVAQFFATGPPPDWCALRLNPEVSVSRHRTFPDLYVVGNGITQNDRILLEGVQNVKDDEKIQYKFLSPRKAISQLKLDAE